MEIPHSDDVLRQILQIVDENIKNPISVICSKSTIASLSKITNSNIISTLSDFSIIFKEKKDGFSWHYRLNFKKVTSLIFVLESINKHDVGNIYSLEKVKREKIILISWKNISLFFVL